MHRSWPVLLFPLLLTLAATPARAEDDDAVLKPAEPDFTLVALPTDLNVPLGKSAFRVTHRFTRPLNCDSCSNSVAGDAFGLDNGAQIGLEYRVGVVKNGQVGIHRTSDKTVNVFGQYAVARQTGSMPIEASLLVAADMTNVGRQGSPTEYSPIIGVIIGRLIGNDAALYVEPMFVHHANVFGLPGDDNTTMVGLGARVKVRPTLYITAEFTPRVSGFKSGVNQGSFSIEKRAGGHMFQLNFTNATGTTLGQVARGGPDGNNWHLGFNISRKFF